MLARHLAYDFPQYFPYFALPGFNYKGVYYPTHDNLIGRYPGADGIKTGFTVASGFNLTSSVVRGGVHLIGIVMGGRTAVRRDLEMMHLLDTAFAQIDANPALVARGPVPWAAVADAGQQPAVAGFTLQLQGIPTAGQLVALSQVPPPIPSTDDEDAAESRRAPDENFSTLASPGATAGLDRRATQAGAGQCRAAGHRPGRNRADCCSGCSDFASGRHRRCNRHALARDPWPSPNAC